MKVRDEASKEERERIGIAIDRLVCFLRYLRIDFGIYPIAIFVPRKWWMAWAGKHKSEAEVLR